jgi:hypothetical protein
MASLSAKRASQSHAAPQFLHHLLSANYNQPIDLSTFQVNRTKTVQSSSNPRFEEQIIIDDLPNDFSEVLGMFHCICMLPPEISKIIFSSGILAKIANKGPPTWTVFNQSSFANT